MFAIRILTFITNYAGVTFDIHNIIKYVYIVKFTNNK
jgi:hypothetical protein